MRSLNTFTGSSKFKLNIYFTFFLHFYTFFTLFTIYPSCTHILVLLILLHLLYSCCNPYTHVPSVLLYSYTSCPQVPLGLLHLLYHLKFQQKIIHLVQKSRVVSYSLFLYCTACPGQSKFGPAHEMNWNVPWSRVPSVPSVPPIHPVLMCLLYLLYS